MVLFYSYYLARLEDNFNIFIGLHIDTIDVIEDPISVDGGKISKVCYCGVNAF